MKLLAISGSARQASTNTALLMAMSHLVPDDVELIPLVGKSREEIAMLLALPEHELQIRRFLSDFTASIPSNSGDDTAPRVWHV